MDINESISKELEEALLSLDRIGTEVILKDLASEMEFTAVLEQAVVPLMEHIGEKWERGDVALSQVFMGGKILEDIVDKMIPQTDTQRDDDLNMALVLYKDHHLLGKRIVLSILRASGYAVKDYGQQHAIDALVEKLEVDKIEVLLISVLMLNSALDIKNLIAKIRDKNLKVIVVVGGAPFRFDTQLGDEIGADYYATEASQVLDIIEKIKKDRA